MPTLDWTGMVHRSRLCRTQGDYECIASTAGALLPWPSRFRKVDALCTRYWNKIEAYAWSTGITTAASLHCSLASPNPNIFECKPFPAVVQGVIVTEKLCHKDGWVYPISGRGMGIEVIEAEVRKIAP